jgi:hypothetical protein
MLSTPKAGKTKPGKVCQAGESRDPVQFENPNYPGCRPFNNAHGRKSVETDQVQPFSREPRIRFFQRTAAITSRSNKLV